MTENLRTGEVLIDVLNEATSRSPDIEHAMVVGHDGLALILTHPPSSAVPHLLPEPCDLGGSEVCLFSLAP